LRVLHCYAARPRVIRSVTYFLYRVPRPPRSTLLPYTTLFRSRHDPRGGVEFGGGGRDPMGHPLHRAFEGVVEAPEMLDLRPHRADRKSTRLNSSHVKISYAVFCLKKKNNKQAIVGRHYQTNKQ